MEPPKTFSELADYEDYQNIETLDIYNKSILNVCKLLYQSLQESPKIKDEKRIANSYDGIFILGLKNTTTEYKNIWRYRFYSITYQHVTDLGVRVSVYIIII